MYPRTAKTSRKSCHVLCLGIDFCVSQFCFSAAEQRQNIQNSLDMQVCRIFRLFQHTRLLFLAECNELRHLVNIQVKKNFIKNYELKFFSCFRTTIRNHHSECKKFCFYCAYAFGIPVALISIVFAFDSSNLIPDDFRPLMGVHRCWIQKSQLIEAVYVYFPIAVIIAANTTFYAITAYKIHKVQTETAVVRDGESSRHSSVDLDKAR